MQNIDIPAAVREYVEAEYRGASSRDLVFRQAQITSALFAADPSLSNTAATFRFHKLVDEYRGNGEISAETLTRIAPAAAPTYVTVTPRRELGQVWHLAAADNNPVPAGEHITDTGLSFTISATPDASCDRQTGEPVRIAVKFSGSERVAWIKAEMLVTGWHWQAEQA